MISYKIKLYPTPHQKRFLARQFATLFREANAYARNLLKDKPDLLEHFNHQCKAVRIPFNEEKEGDETFSYPSLKQEAIARVTSQQRIKGAIYPIFHNGKMTFNLTRFKHGKTWFSYIGNRLVLGKNMSIRTRKKSRFPGHPLRVCIMYQDGTYWAGFVYQYTPKKLKKTGKSVGIDLGMHTLASCVDSTRKTFKLSVENYFSKKVKDKLAHYYQLLSRKTLDNKQLNYSNRCLKTMRKIRELFARAVNYKTPKYYEIANNILRKYDIIGLETLAVEDMVKRRSVAKRYLASPFYGLSIILQKKSALLGKEVVMVDRHFPSSQICSSCGYRTKITKDLSVRSWTCTHCGATHDRDINAAANILSETLRLMGPRR